MCKREPLLAPVLLFGIFADVLRVAIVGCGLVSSAHIEAYLAEPGRARIIACCDPIREKAERAAHHAGGAKVYTRFEEVLADPEIDSIDLLTPHDHHRDGVEMAARAGKHILCQKPLARTLDDADRMIAAAEDAGVHLFYGEMSRTANHAIAAHRLIEEGRVGQVVGLQGTYSNYQSGDYLKTAWRYDPASAGGGQLLDGGIHELDYLLHFGGPVAGVMCHTAQFRPELGGEDTATLSLRFQSGALGTLFTSHASAQWMPEAHCMVFGTDGLLALGGKHGALTLYRRGQAPEVIVEHRSNVFHSMIARYLDLVVDGAASASPARVGREALEVVLAAYRSAAERREVTI